MAIDKFNEITVDERKCHCVPMEKIEDDYITAGGVLDDATERLVINVNHDSDSEC